MTDDFKKADDLIARLHKYCFFQQVRTGENCGFEEYDFEFLHDFINRQKAEIERYQKEHKEFCIRLGYLHSLELKVMERADEIKAEAVKEFVERVVEGRLEDNPVVIAVKCELKEMVGESTTEDSSVTQETRKSKWEIDCDGYYPYCPNCGKEPPSGKMTDFCPNCGKDMRGGK